MAKVLWTQKQDVGPGARGAHAISYDGGRQRVVLFGGRAGGGTPQADTWDWDGTDWTQVADTGPDARSGHALAYDSNRQRVVMFGGEAAGSALRADTWEWDGALWKQVADTGPGPSMGFSLTFGAGATLLFGGVSTPPPPAATQQLTRLSWQWDGAHWTLRQDMGPAPRWGHALAFDSARARAVLFGGFTLLPADTGVADSVVADTWEATVEEIPGGGPGPGPGPTAGIALVSFTLNPDTVTGEGPPGSGTDVSFEVGIDTPAPPGGVQVDIWTGDAVLLSVWVPDGETMGSLVVTIPGDVPFGDYDLEARLGDDVLTAVLHVVPTP